MKNCQIQLFNMCIAEFNTDETFAKVVDHIFLMQLVFLNQHHADGGIIGHKIKDEVLTVVKLMEEWGHFQGNLEGIECSLSLTIPHESYTLF